MLLCLVATQRPHVPSLSFCLLSSHKDSSLLAASNPSSAERWCLPGFQGACLHSSTRHCSILQAAEQVCLLPRTAQHPQLASVLLCTTCFFWCGHNICRVWCFESAAVRAVGMETGTMHRDRRSKDLGRGDQRLEMEGVDVMVPVSAQEAGCFSTHPTASRHSTIQQPFILWSKQYCSCSKTAQTLCNKWWKKHWWDEELLGWDASGMFQHTIQWVKTRGGC